MAKIGPPLTSPSRLNPSLHLSILLVVTLILTLATRAVCHRAQTTIASTDVGNSDRYHNPLRLTVPDLVPRSARGGVPDVGPALYNATQTAIEHARTILANYSTVLHGIAIPAGLAVAFFGYFLLTPVLFLSAFIAGGGASFVAVSSILDEATPTNAWVSIGAMLLGGALFGFVAMRALPVGMFAVGASLGVIFASALRTTIIANLFPDDPRTAFIVTAVVLGLVLGLLAVMFEKHMLVFSTAYAGACACVFGIGHFAGHFPTSDDISAVEKGSVDAWALLYLTVALAMGTAGMFFQFWLARDRPMPEYAPYDRRRRRRRARRYEEPADYDYWSGDEGRGGGWRDDVYEERAPLPPPRRKPPPAAVRAFGGGGRGGRGEDDHAVMDEYVRAEAGLRSTSAALPSDAQEPWNAAQPQQEMYQQRAATPFSRQLVEPAVEVEGASAVMGGADGAGQGWAEDLWADDKGEGEGKEDEDRKPVGSDWPRASPLPAPALMV